MYAIEVKMNGRSIRYEAPSAEECVRLMALRKDDSTAVMRCDKPEPPSAPPAPPPLKVRR